MPQNAFKLDGADTSASRQPSRSAKEQSSVGRSRPVTVVCALAILSLTVVALAQPPQPAADAPAGQAKPASSLAVLSAEQNKIAEKYARLEQLLIRMSELEAASNPQRAALLKRAAQQSSEKFTRQQLTTLVKLLAPPAQLKRATDEQQQVIVDLKALLELLQSENRADRLKGEQARIKDYIKEVDRLIRLQQGIQGRTEGGDDAQKLAQDQGQLGDRTGQLSQKLEESEGGGKAGEDSKKSDGSPESGKAGGEKGKKEGDSPDAPEKNGDKGGEKSDEKKQGSDDPSSKDGKGGDAKSEKSSDSAKGKGEPGADSKGEPKGQPGDEGKSESTPGSTPGSDSKSAPKKGDSGKSAGEPQPPGESPESPPSEEQPGQEQDSSNPARKRLQAAEERMRAAQKKLEEAKHRDAAQDQELARQELEKAKNELEEILRQMREEEIERTLAMLEGRFRRMLDGQLKIYESTKRLDKIPAAQRTRDVEIQAGKLGFEEGKLAVEADKALLLLREEGSSVAFPETVELMRDDMQQVADRLSAGQIDQVTQSIEEEIIQTLEELIAALQKAQQDLKDKKPPPPLQQQAGDESQKPLVDKLAELKMIRSLQMRVNTRTQRYSRLLEDIEDPVGKANDADLRQSLIKLADMEKRVHEITRNLVLGKNE